MLGRPRQGADGLAEFTAGPDDQSDLVVACGRVDVTYAGLLQPFDQLHEPIVLDFTGSDEMRFTFAQLLEEARRQSQWRGTMMRALMHQCIVLVFRELCRAPDCEIPWLVACNDPRIAPAINTILAAPERHHTLDSLATTASMSRSAFAAHFLQALGRSPIAFLRDVRLRLGADLLRTTDLSVAAITRRVGFTSRSYFSRSFREYFGTAPLDYRLAETT